MDVRESIKNLIRDSLSSLGLEMTAEIHLERPANVEHGDWSTNIALALAKKAKSSPRDLAVQLATALESLPSSYVSRLEVAGPGFVNFYLNKSWLYEVLLQAVNDGTENWARSEEGSNKKVIVEFVSANPTGPLHAGHGRGACYGDSVARILERSGYLVAREFYVNDRGTQMNLFASSLAACTAGENIPEDGYHGAYIKEWAAEIPRDQDPLEWGKKRALSDQREVLRDLNIEFDSWFSETSLVDSGLIEKTLSMLAKANASYEKDGATWLKSTEYGDDKDRVLVKSDGEYTYLLPDITYHLDKLTRAERLINVWGADHHGYITRMKAAIESLGHEPERLEVEVTQMVNLQRSGEEVKLSKRTGDIVELSEVVKEVGSDAARFTYLLQSIDTTQTFDLDLVSKRVNENPIFYVQYAYARIRSMMKKADEIGFTPLPLSEVDLSQLQHQRELILLRALHELPDVVERASRELAPHQITTWLREFAADLHGFYHDCRILGDDIEPSLTQARFLLMRGVLIGLEIGMDLLGVSAPEEMWRDEIVEEGDG
ncbi:MAG TPA: arginine--tRNA ligase [Acidimicrobiaceae bacterium]|nr:arginine--tRNA ligase [Acidimicrobiaceae bacterium]|tara:strand:- start:11130 stop:12767 length:1638 start_codon:yes stop_codon:yes gene_type:complete